MFKIIRPILSIAIALLVYFFFIQPMYADVGVLKGEVEQYETVVAQAADFNRLLDGLSAKMNSFSAFDLERLDQMVPEDIDEVRALVDLEALALQHGLVFENVTVTFTEGVEEEIVEEEIIPDPELMTEDGMSMQPATLLPPAFVTQDISFSVYGTYDQFQAFLSDVERSLVFMEITKIAFTVSEGDIINYQMTVRLFGIDDNERSAL